MRRQACLALIVAALGAGALARAAPPAGDAPAEPEAAAHGALADQRAILSGYRRYHATCSHCHGPDGIGSSFGRSLIDAPLPWAEFEAVVMAGTATGNFVMRGFADDPNVAPYVGDIYAYLKARAAGAIGRGRPALEP
jgi:mono/diheme cytochrome c family protein